MTSINVVKSAGFCQITETEAECCLDEFASSIRVTDQIYAHLAPTTVRAAVEVLDVDAVSRSGFTLTKNDAEEVEDPAATG